MTSRDLAWMAAAAAALAGGPASAAEYRLVSVERGIAVVVETPPPPRAGIRRLNVYSARRTPTPEGVLYGRMLYGFDCAKRTVRAEGQAVFDAELRVRSQRREVSPWRRLPDELRMPEFFAFACSGKPPAPATLLSAPIWTRALLEARGRLGP